MYKVILLIVILIAVRLPGYSQVPGVSSGELTRIENFPSKYITPRSVDVWIPDGYSADQRYAVLYMHDGQMLFDSTINWNHQEWGVDETAGKLIKEKKIKPCIVVGIWNNGPARHSEFFPLKPYEKLPDAYKDSLLLFAKRADGAVIFSGKIQSDNYLKFIVKELKPYVDSAFSTLGDQENTFIAGSSMGGLISLYAICEYPRVFGGAACLSTHWTVIYTAEKNPIPNVILNYMREHLPSPATHKIYFDYGTETLDTLYEPFQMQVDLIMQQKGYTSENWTTIKFRGDDHSEKSWGKRFDIPLEFLIGKN
jgi:enterochelin esterase-like enzyme